MANITHGGHVGIVGVGQTNHARRRTDVSQAGLVREAVDRALADANLTMEDIDSVVVASGPVLFAAVNQPEKWVVNAIGAQNKPVVRVTSGGGAGFAGALAGYYQVAGGFAERTLVVAYDKLSEGQLQYSISTLYDPFWGREFAVGIMGFSAAYWRARMDALGHTEEAAAMVLSRTARTPLPIPMRTSRRKLPSRKCWRRSLCAGRSNCLMCRRSPTARRRSFWHRKRLRRNRRRARRGYKASLIAARPTMPPNVR